VDGQYFWAFWVAQISQLWIAYLFQLFLLLWAWCPGPQIKLIHRRALEGKNRHFLHDSSGPVCTHDSARTLISNILHHLSFEIHSHYTQDFMLTWEESRNFLDVVPQEVKYSCLRTAYSLVFEKILLDVPLYHWSLNSLTVPYHQQGMLDQVSSPLYCKWNCARWIHCRPTEVSA